MAGRTANKQITMTKRNQIQNAHKEAIEKSTINGRVRPLPCSYHATEVTIEELKKYEAWRQYQSVPDNNWLVNAYLNQSK
jgi:hypothetical protein